MNSSEINTSTMDKINKTTQIFIMAIEFLMFLMFCIFVYFMVIILKVFFTTPKVRETARYILFIHMLVNDVFYLLLAFVLFICRISLVAMPVPLCYTVFSVTTCAFGITPYNLAAMSLERYAAICHPLRHMELWSVRRATLTIANMWTVGMIPQLAYFAAYCFSVDKRVFGLSVLCHWTSLSVNLAQEIIKTLYNFLSFSVVGLIIAYTYIRVMLVARKIDSEKFASKAGKTVLLHAFQLLLSLLSFTTTITESQFTSSFVYLPFLNFFFLMCFPRFISPLIYGIRDEVFGKPMRKFFPAVRIQSEDR